ncbi:hypothetical protein O3P69_007935 [Scylla paramamosain]|uniref:Uncharacterized protein n=1 Tax=Scylla paramamosain TaxID=85552 RepID=A0AAW0T087_SCYPA
MEAKQAEPLPSEVLSRGFVNPGCFIHSTRHWRHCLLHSPPHLTSVQWCIARWKVSHYTEPYTQVEIHGLQEPSPLI